MTSADPEGSSRVSSGRPDLRASRSWLLLDIAEVRDLTGLEEMRLAARGPSPSSTAILRTYSNPGTSPSIANRPSRSVVTSRGKGGEVPLSTSAGPRYDSRTPERGRPSRSTRRPETAHQGRSLATSGPGSLSRTARVPASLLCSWWIDSTRMRRPVRPVTRKAACSRDCHQPSRAMSEGAMPPTTAPASGRPSASRIRTIGSGPGVRTRSHVHDSADASGRIAANAWTRSGTINRPGFGNMPRNRRRSGRR